MGPSIARVEYVDSQGVSDYRNVFISDRHSPKLTSGSDADSLKAIMTDPKTLSLHVFRSNPPTKLRH